MRRRAFAARRVRAQMASFLTEGLQACAKLCIAVRASHAEHRLGRLGCTDRRHFEEILAAINADGR